METKGIIFDYGGVFSDGVSLSPFFNDFAKIYNRDPKEFKHVFNSRWHKAKVNEMPSSQLWTEVADYLQVSAKQLRDDLTGYFKFNFDTLDLARRLKPNYKLGLMSNNIEDWLEENINELNLRSVFDCIVGSYHCGAAKPDKKIYLTMLDEIKLKPEECIFIDDMERNLVPARGLGMVTIRFESTKQLREELSRLRIRY